MMLREILVNSLILSLSLIEVELAEANPLQTSFSNRFPDVSSIKDSSRETTFKPKILQQKQNYLETNSKKISNDIVEIPMEKQNQSFPSELNSNPNPLLLPTEQDIKQSQEHLIAITLEQAIELAKRNNQQLKIAILQLESSRAGLAEATAALYPTLSLSTTATRALSASGELAAQANEKQQIATLNGFETQLQNSQALVNFLQGRVNAKQEELDQINNIIVPSPPTDIAPDLAQQIEALSPFFVPQSAVTQFAGQTQIKKSIELEFLTRDLQQAQSSLQSQQEQIASTQQSIAQISNFVTTTVDGKLSLSYNIYSPGRQANINSAKETLKINELEVTRIEDQLILDVALAYYDLQQADAQVLIFQNDINDRTKRLESIELMLNVGLATKLDLLNAQVDLDNAIQELRNNQAIQETTRRNLATILNLPASITPIAGDPVSQTGVWQLPLDKTILLAFKKRVELEQRLAERQRSGAQQQLALAVIRPSLSIFAEYNILSLSSEDPNRFTPKGTEDGYAFGLNFNWLFFDGGAATSRAKQAATGMAIAEQQYSETANNIRLEVERAYYQLQPQLRNIETATQSIKRAEEALKAAEIRFDLGVNTQTEVLDARNRLVRAQNNLINAIITYNRSFAQLQRAAGFRLGEN
ncbi:MAG: TolC family protein [Microcystis sp. M048S1]|uniref:TolC family protein n=2 Tax=Microcystaceae TaxID=1890449 RepID=UPI0009BDB5FC|nr:MULTISPECIES: TolC family protein [Microcystis]MCA2900211.1 TolC family protein [Microcystis sp. M035S1]MCA2728297.1 TolC family protein [Microcystis sp. M166S2]MCA2781418.1 TolC family protein [Microcystis sp. M136S2]MCA2784858.1 TolC family protein [Microcystis sp. M125S2]MCA2875793.1 TolC family protein [Microcystis sp. M051S1]